MSRFFSKKYGDLTPYTPGEQPRDMRYIKLNTNESPFPPSPKAQAYAKKAAEDLQLYSDPTCTQLAIAAAEYVLITEVFGSSTITSRFFRTPQKTEALLPCWPVTLRWVPAA